MSSSKEKVLLLAAGAVAGALILSAAQLSKRRCGSSRSSSGGGGRGSTNKGNADATERRKQRSSSLGEYRDARGSSNSSADGTRMAMPYQHEAKMRDRIERNLTPDSKKLGESGGKEGTDEGDPSVRLERQLSKMMSSLDIREAIMLEAAQERTKVTVRVPATSANMGPGYDCLGMALNMWSEVTVERADKFEMVYEGEGFEEVPLDESNYIVVGLKSAFESAGKEMPVLKYKVINRIPYARGLGSSSAAIAAGLIAGLALAGHRLPCWGSEELLQLACEIEGHPDNVAPVIYGGCQMGIHNGERWQSERVPLPAGLQVVLFIPDFIGKTSTARGVLNDTVTRDEAKFTLGRVAWLINALSSGNLDNLKCGFQDALHQPQRAAAVYPYLNDMMEAAVEAGACGAYLSGAGPTVAALTSGASGDIFTQREAERVDRQVAEAMLEAARDRGVEGQVFVTTPSDGGAYIVSAEPRFSEGIIKYPADLHALA